MTHNNIILFDGVCNLCEGTVQFVIKHDSKKKFKFAQLQSDIGKQLLKKHGLEHDNLLQSIVLIQNDKAYLRSTAAVKICKELDGLWPGMYAFILVPRFLRDAVYNGVGVRRYKWFGKKESCWLPTDDIKNRFL